VIITRAATGEGIYLIDLGIICEELIPERGAPSNLRKQIGVFRAVKKGCLRETMHKGIRPLLPTNPFLVGSTRLKKNSGQWVIGPGPEILFKLK
jgi:hypothetical protein